MSRWDVPPDTTLAGLLDEWRAAMVNQVGAGTVDMYATHCAHLVRHFGSAEAITKAGIADYGRKRLGQVMRKTLQKERSTLNGFLAWCEERGYLHEAPEVIALPRRATGTRAQPVRKVTVLTPDEARALVAHLPQWTSSRRDVRAFPVRARFVVAFETALRPATLSALSVPEHYTKGATALVITDEIDKARFGRELPLTERARVALDTVAPARGLIFGSHDYRHQLERAAKKALEPERAATFSAYDLRHSRATEWVEQSGDIAGTAFLLGHRHVTTTDRYTHPGPRAGKRVLDAASVSPTGKERIPVGDVQRLDIITVRAKKRTRTSTPFRVLEPESDARTALSDRAKTLLHAAASGQHVDNSELYDFARAALSTTEIGRIALAVLDGGAFSRARAVELARMLAEPSERLLEGEL